MLKYRFNLPVRPVAIALVFLGVTWGSRAQHLEELKERKWLNYGGGISSNFTGYDVRGIENRRDPFFWQLNANMNLSILGIVQLPFSFTLSQQNRSFSQPQPFNRFGMSPSYKSLTLHLGHRSMNFSSFTLAGNLFFGAGAEYKPESNPLRVSMMYGRFAKPVARFARQGQVFATPTYRRIGYGTKVGFSKNGQEAHLIIFRASDDPISIPRSDTLKVKPEENLVLGLVGSFKLTPNMSWKADYAYSMHSRDASTPEVFIDQFTFVNNLGGLFTPTASSSYSTALNTSLNFSGDGYQLNLTYRKVDPGYTTLGSSFLSNDIEDIAGGVSIPIWSGRATFSANTGLQRNNLDQQLSSQIRRLIYGMSTTVSFTEQLNVSLNYSNFNSSTRQTVIQTDLLSDTLEYVQVSRNGSAMINYAHGSEDHPLALSYAYTIQDIEDNSGVASTFSSNVLSGQKKLAGDWTLSLSATANKNVAAGIETLTAGPVINVSRAFYKGKVRTAFGHSVLSVYRDQQLESTVNSVRSSANARIGERHNFSVNLFYVIRKYGQEIEKPDIKELRATLNYNFKL